MKTVNDVNGFDVHTDGVGSSDFEDSSRREIDLERFVRQRDRRSRGPLIVYIEESVKNQQFPRGIQRSGHILD